jgi:hypothetical protein
VSSVTASMPSGIGRSSEVMVASTRRSEGAWKVVAWKPEATVHASAASRSRSKRAPRQRRSSSRQPSTMSAAEPMLQPVGISPNASQPSSAAHTRPVYSSGAARLASTCV